MSSFIVRGGATPFNPAPDERQKVVETVTTRSSEAGWSDKTGDQIIADFMRVKRKVEKGETRIQCKAMYLCERCWSQPSIDVEPVDTGRGKKEIFIQQTIIHDCPCGGSGKAHFVGLIGVEIGS